MKMHHAVFENVYTTARVETRMSDLSCDLVVHIVQTSKHGKPVVSLINSNLFI